MIIITAKRDGFRRCGIAHRATPIEYPDEAFTPAQLVLLRAEPMLDVQHIEEAAPAQVRPRRKR
jgi:hypothetical protein